MFLSAARLRERVDRTRGYPWTVPAVASFESLAFLSPVTFLMGENGCGKSTLLEALAIASRATAARTAAFADDPSYAGSRALADALRLTFTARKRPATRLFFAAEDARGFGAGVGAEMAALEQIAVDLDADETAGPAARARAAGYVRGQQHSLARRYGSDPLARSHGEAFTTILRERLVPNGLYFLDEPETPLSPTRVLALLMLIRASVRAGSQFVIATHSPLLAALPGATILHVRDAVFERVDHDDLDHVRITRDFLNAPERYLRHLEADDPPEDDG